jgi:hypothetical protein
MLHEEAGLATVIFQSLCCAKANNGENIVVHFSRLHTTPVPEMSALLPIEVQGLFRIQKAMKGKCGKPMRR